ncbi:RHS repeat-associated core domain-containing protein [Luteibacter sp. Lutesp34]|uniref:RHS repeat-associated core domain-containing protein n=1 Tax=Luteibacter sp. Lutesp34 TaxID=3243030 RepID=UPI0039B43F3E
MTVDEHVYSAYGGRADVTEGAHSAYAGDRLEDGGYGYMLGERLYAPTLRHFLKPDVLSPFASGGCNRYTYCRGDPINHVDPSGYIRRRWSPVSNAHVAAGRNMRRGAGDAPGSSFTPGMSIAATAAAVDVATISAGIPQGSLVAARPPVDMVLGQLVAKATLAPIAPGRPRSGSRTKSGARRSVTVLHEENFPQDRQTVDRLGRPAVTPKWFEHLHLFNEESTIWAADSVISEDHFPPLFQMLQARGVTHLSLYSGAHGNATGKNWAGDSGFKTEQLQFDFLSADLFDTTSQARAAGIHVYVADMRNLSRKTMQEMLAEDGVHVIGYCFGIADREVMRAIGLKDVTVFEPWIQDPRQRGRTRPHPTP